MHYDYIFIGAGLFSATIAHAATKAGKKCLVIELNDDVEVTADDRIITLSTCNSNDNERYLVQAVLVSIEE